MLLLQLAGMALVLYKPQCQASFAAGLAYFHVQEWWTFAVSCCVGVRSHRQEWWICAASGCCVACCPMSS